MHGRVSDEIATILAARRRQDGLLGRSAVLLVTWAFWIGFPAVEVVVPLYIIF